MLVTGMSGVGKSALVGELSSRGYKAVDTDDGLTERGAEGDWLWREDLVGRLLDTEDADVLFLSGCVTNQGKFYGRFDLIVLLSAPAEVMLERLATRTTNTYGKTPEERAEVLGNLRAVEPLLRRGAGLEFDTRTPLKEIADRLLRRLELI